MAKEMNFLFNKKVQQIGTQKSIVYGVSWKDSPFEESTYEKIDNKENKGLIQRFEILEGMSYLSKYDNLKVVVNNKQIVEKREEVDEQEVSQTTLKKQKNEDEEWDKENLILQEVYQNRQTKKISEKMSEKWNKKLRLFNMKEIVGKEQNENVYKMCMMKESVSCQKIKNIEGWEYGMHEDRIQIFVKIGKGKNSYVKLRDIGEELPWMGFNFLLDNSVLIKS